MTRPYEFAETNGVRVAWQPELEGGGRTFGRDFVPVVGHLFGRVGRLYEMCCGAGYIGFSLLAHGNCDELVLSDINPAAIEAVHETIRINGLEDRVTVYQSDALASIPDGEEWDLVVSNPPHFPIGSDGRTERALRRRRLAHASRLLQRRGRPPRTRGLDPLSREQLRWQSPRCSCRSSRTPVSLMFERSGTRAASPSRASTTCGSRRRSGLGVRGAADSGRSSSPRRTRRRLCDLRRPLLQPAPGQRNGSGDPSPPA